MPAKFRGLVELRGRQISALRTPARSRLSGRTPFIGSTRGNPASIPRLLFSACVATIRGFDDWMGCP